MRALTALVALPLVAACAIAAPSVPRSSLTADMFAGHAFVDDDLDGHRISFAENGRYTEAVPVEDGVALLYGYWRIDEGLLCFNGDLRTNVCLEVGRHRETITLSNQTGALMRGRLEPTATAE